MPHFSYMVEVDTLHTRNYQRPMGQMPMNSSSDNLVEMFSKCALHCDNMMTHCLMMPDMESRRVQCRLLIECASICHQTACMLARVSQYVGGMLSIYAQVSLQCAAACRSGVTY